MAPLGAQAADLVVWWEKGYYAQEDDAVREIVAAFEQESGKQVELVFQQQEEFPAEDRSRRSRPARRRTSPSAFCCTCTSAQWALEDRLVDLTDAVGHFSDLFDPDALDQAVLLNAKTGRKALYGLPIGRSTNHLHVWKSLLEQAGFTLADIPKDWDAFWSFWCDQVQPAVRRATGSRRLWGIGLPMSAGADDTGPNSSSSWPPTTRTM